MGLVPPADPRVRPAFAALDDDDLRWSVARLPGRMPEATYLVVANAAQFRLVVDVVADEQGHSLTGVSREQLPALLCDRLPDALYVDLEQVLDARLRQLVAWGTFESWQDEARTDEDFLRNRERFQLTERGAAVNRLARAVEGQDRATSSTAVLAPPILATQTAIAVDALAAQRYADAAATLALVQTTLADMAQTASVWQSRLAATIGGTPDEDKVRRLRQTVTDYVDMWGAGVDVHSASISGSARRLLDSDSETWRVWLFTACLRMPRRRRSRPSPRRSTTPSTRSRSGSPARTRRRDGCVGRSGTPSRSSGAIAPFSRSAARSRDGPSCST